jgi:predicted DNA-binding transcriptional regulator AlpA
MRVSKSTGTAVVFLNEFEVSERLGISVQTSRRWRLLNMGPPWRKFSRCVRYGADDLAQWIESRPGGGQR